MANQTTIRIVGGLMLLSITLSILFNMVHLGPIVFGKDFMTEVAANGDKVKWMVLMELMHGALSLGIALALLTTFLNTNKTLAYGYLAFSVFHFVIIAIDLFEVLSIYSLSKEFAAAGSPDGEYWQILGTQLYENRWWSHYMTLLIGSFPLVFFYALLFQSRVVPRFISVWGMLSLPLLVTAIIMAMFDQGTNMDLMTPLGINQIFLAGWLIVKGFKQVE